MTENRNDSAETLILEEELLTSPPDRVFDWFKSRSITDGKIRENELDSEVELKLLARKERLIDLAIGYYGIHEEAIRVLFKKAREENNEAVILACLSNTVISKAGVSYPNFPEDLLDSDVDKLEWFKGITKKQIYALFKNSGIDDSFLEEYLEGSDYWKVIDDDRRVQSLAALCRNPRLQKKYEGMMDGYAEYKFNSVYVACWNLAKTLPVTQAYANVLGELLSKIVDDRYEFDSLVVSKRWIIKDENKKETKKQFLNGFESVRYAIYRDIIKNSKSNRDSFSNEDIAYRACAYSKLLITEDEIRSAYKKDKLLAIQYISDNLGVWRYEKYREVLSEICWDADTKYNNNYMDCANMYNWKEEDLKEKHPDWFLEKEDEDYVDDDDKLVTVGILKSHLSELHDSSFNHSVQIMSGVNSLSGDVGKIRWWIIGCFVLLLILVIR